jgi:hypothetical protein
MAETDVKVSKGEAFTAYCVVGPISTRLTSVLGLCALQHTKPRELLRNLSYSEVKMRYKVRPRRECQKKSVEGCVDVLGFKFNTL